MQRVTHQDRETAYRISDRAAGGATTMLCVHGSGGDHGVWKAQARLADEVAVAALDLSGHGESDDVDADAGYETLSAYADDVVAVAEETGATVLCGNSLGGAVALWIALERDLTLDGLVLAGTGARLSVLEDLLAWLESDFDRAVEFLHGEDRLFHDPQEAYLELSRAAMGETGRAVTERDFRTCHAFDVRDRLDELSLPTLAICGEYDQLTPPHYHEYLAEELDGELALIEDAAHLAMLEAPEAFNSRVRTFVLGLE